MEKTLIGCVYRSPNSSEENNTKLNNFIKSLGDMKNTNLIMIGDFNYPKISWTDEGYGMTEYNKSLEFLNSVMDAYLILFTLYNTYFLFRFVYYIS